MKIGDIPTDREITIQELLDVELKEAVRGYNHHDVNDLIERAAAALDAAHERIRGLTERLAAYEK